MVDKEKEIIACLVDILEQGLLNARYYSEKGKMDRVVSELQHIHNIPSIIRNYSEERIQFYMEVESRSYERDVDSVCLLFKEKWHRLKELNYN